MKGFGKTARKTTFAELKRLPPSEKKKIGVLTEYSAGEIYVHSRVNSRDKKPMVDVAWDKNRTEFTPTEAFEFALGIMQCAIAAETDSLLIEWMTRVIGVELEIAGALLLEFRKFREENPSRFTAWRGQALDILRAAETMESDEFLKDFFEKVKESSGKPADSLFDVESTIEEFQQLRETRRGGDRV
jgi:hypothetical protein